ncbi:MAG: hypothetical protein KatS3mg002_1604 [Candidatus Woesearchaeota archaeon]|nr:MAG: hypothetical protein KatS3mg002_1604 [Candidatus Woesearchaeota archaeon]
MKISHKLSEKYTEERTDINSSIFMLTRNGDYFSIPVNPNYNISNYLGYFLNIKGVLFKTLENIYLSDDIEKKVPFEIVNGFNCFERLYENYYESFTLVNDGLIYEVESNDEVYVEIELDFRWIHDYDDIGREYKIHKIDDSIIIDYNKYTDSSLKNKSYSGYMIINGVFDNYEIINKWVKKNYDYDSMRNSRSEFYVYHALRIKFVGKNKLLFSFSDKKIDAFEKIFNIKKKTYRIGNYSIGNSFDYYNNYLELKYNLKELTGKKTAFAYVNAVNNLNNLMITSSGISGLWAGLPWFFQYWSRDELISLKALILEGKKDFVKQIIMRHINSILSNGRIPNIYIANLAVNYKKINIYENNVNGGDHSNDVDIAHNIPYETSGIGSADSIGWLFRRLKDILIMLEENISYFDLDELFLIRERLYYSINQILKNYYYDGLIRNDALETWMDTSYGNDYREGFRIEIQCGFLCMLNLFNMLNNLLSKSFSNNLSPTTFEFNYLVLEDKMKSLVKERFFVNGYLNDGWNCTNDYVSRPNVFLAYYLYPELLENSEWESIFDNALSRLWVDWGDDFGGLATIDKEHPLYSKRYTGQNNISYHRGDSWYYLNNLAAICMSRLNKDKYFSYITKILNSSTEDILFNGFIGAASEVSSISKLEPAGCFCQTWSIATYIELIHELFIS